MPPKINVNLLVDCFEHIALNILDIPLGERNSANIKNLVHPVHQQLTVFGWELG